MNNWMGYVIGSLTFLNRFFNGYVICVHPAFKTGELSAKGDPYGGYTGGEKEMMAYLQANPKLAQKAGAAAVAFASANPEAAASMAQGAGGNGALAAAAVAGASSNANAGAKADNPWS